MIHVTYINGGVESSVSIDDDDEFNWIIESFRAIKNQYGSDYAKQCELIYVYWHDGEISDFEDEPKTAPAWF